MARSRTAAAAQQSPTAPGFGMSQVLNSDVEQKLSSLPTVNRSEWRLCSIHREQCSGCQKLRACN
jgi:hypothetical protein